VLQLKVLVAGSKVSPKGPVTVPLLYVMTSLPTQLLGLNVNAGTV
jgi:hypothetical protein